MRLFSIVFMIIFFAACGNKAMSPLQHKGQQIILGNGGGFTGAVSTFYFTDDGTLYRTGMDDTTFVKVGIVDSKITKQFFSNYDMLGLKNMDLNDPGNRYYFVTMKDKDGTEHKIQWGRNQLENNSVSIYYDNIMALIKKMNKENVNSKVQN